ncbi:hypothetical protein AN639_12375 [Candidatus Epulonipiscium fishelsonii]|nr:hypothetical protein AN639_12375 [Epulopiscium sp. SCG-B05WGA-EpuloA1]
MNSRQMSLILASGSIFINSTVNASSLVIPIKKPLLKKEIDKDSIQDHQEIIDIPDKNLRRIVLSLVDKNFDGKIQKDEIKSMRSFYADKMKIEDLTGLEHAVNLEILSLKDNNIKDLSIIHSFKNLKILRIDNNPIDMEDENNKILIEQFGIKNINKYLPKTNLKKYDTPKPKPKVILNENISLNENVLSEKNITTNGSITTDVIIKENISLQRNIIEENNIITEENIITDGNNTVGGSIILSENEISQESSVTTQGITMSDTNITTQDIDTTTVQNVNIQDTMLTSQDVTTKDTMLTLQDVDTTTIQDIHIQDIDTKTVQDVNTQDIIVTIQDVTTPDTMLTIQDVTTPDTAVIEQDIATLNTNVIPQKYVVRSEVSQENTTNNEGGVISDIMEQNVSKNITKSEYGLFDKLEINVDDMYNTALKLIQVKNSQEASTIKKLFLKAIPYTYMNGQLSLNSLPDTLSREFDNIELHSIISNLKLLDLLSLYNIGKEISLDDITASEFVDISMHWAENSINEANKNGFIGGVTSDLFAPEQELYVADTFTFLDRLLLSNNVLKMNLPRETVEKYVPNKMDWTFYHVASIGSKLSENTLKQVMSSSEDNITRGMFAQILFEITDKQLPKIKYDYNFIDIDNSPYNEAITYCIETGLLCGISQNEMAPNKMLTRAELAAVLVRLDEKLG